MDRNEIEDLLSAVLSDFLVERGLKRTLETFQEETRRSPDYLNCESGGRSSSRSKSSTTRSRRTSCNARSRKTRLLLLAQQLRQTIEKVRKIDRRFAAILGALLEEQAGGRGEEQCGYKTLLEVILQFFIVNLNDSLPSAYSTSPITANTFPCGTTTRTTTTTTTTTTPGTSNTLLLLSSSLPGIATGAEDKTANTLPRNSSSSSSSSGSQEQDLFSAPKPSALSTQWIKSIDSTSKKGVLVEGRRQQQIVNNSPPAFVTVPCFSSSPPLLLLPSPSAHRKLSSPIKINPSNIHHLPQEPTRNKPSRSSDIRLHSCTTEIRQLSNTETSSVPPPNQRNQFSEVSLPNTPLVSSGPCYARSSSTGHIVAGGSRNSREEEREEADHNHSSNSSSSFTVPELSPPEQQDPHYQSYINNVQAHQPRQSHRNIGLGLQTRSNSYNNYCCSQLSPAQNLLASKQNMLAQVSLTPEENLARRNNSPSPVDLSPEGNNCSDGGSGSLFMLTKSSNKKDGGFFRASSDLVVGATTTADEEEGEETPPAVPTTIDTGSKSNKMMLCDIEDEDFDFKEEEDVTTRGTTTTGGSNGNNFYNQSGDGFSRLKVNNKPFGAGGDGGGGGGGRPVLKVMDTQTWRDLKMTTVGPNGSFQEGWLHQAFSFDQNVPYGLVQKRGGPCGVLAVVQALVIRNLMFGSPYCEDDDLPLSEPDMIFSKDPTAMRVLSFRRTKALVCALAEILWRCGNVGDNTSSVFNEDQRGGSLASGSVWSDFKLLTSPDSTKENSSSSCGATVCFNGACIGAEMRTFDQIAHLKNYIHVNLQKFDCISLVYSAVLSRGVDNVQQDLDFPNCPLIVSHGYCSQELVNLLTVGKAISNVFDNEVKLDEKVLKGMESRCDIGLLSLFEHYDSCQVGSFLKSPKFPLWIVCSESHFSLLFSSNMSLVSEPSIDSFELYYYDGLSRQQNHIKLTIELNPTVERVAAISHLRIRAGSSATSFNNNNNNNNNDCDDEHLVPPIEKCIRTKWPAAAVDWNETEPIL